MEFEWDDLKNLANTLKHGIRFEVAQAAFDDPRALRMPDIRHSTIYERRDYLIGSVGEDILVIVFTIRQPQKRVRIISARTANRKERRLYNEA